MCDTQMRGRITQMATRQDWPAKSEVNPARKQRKPLLGGLSLGTGRSTKFGGGPPLIDRRFNADCTVADSSQE